jgi:MoxR-like ATPase
MRLLLDEEQLRVLNWRTNNSDIAALEGPPGCGKTTVGIALAVSISNLSHTSLLLGEVQ